MRDIKEMDEYRPVAILPLFFGVMVAANLLAFVWWRANDWHNLWAYLTVDNILGVGVIAWIVQTCGGPKAVLKHYWTHTIQGYYALWTLQDGKLDWHPRLRWRATRACDPEFSEGRYTLCVKLGGWFSPEVILVNNTGFQYTDLLITSVSNTRIRIEGRGEFTIEQFLKICEQTQSTDPAEAAVDLLARVEDLRGEVNRLTQEVAFLRRDRDWSRTSARWALSILKQIVRRIDGSDRLKTTREGKALRAYAHLHLLWCRNQAPEHIARHLTNEEFNPQKGYPKDEEVSAGR